ncbi:hypothetical protein Afil01_64290 [Actinorhabdospora filicis]|uniref:HTH tetR-type domain-containing protein n=1 Tax=Actinorhabdospora filicis TaxID=1785913 RepID=A0A9W6W6J9_9ACTN|nr:TetR/AcrR family transcriptional regulator C-terminal domain-containing protein [Actinorhabdospora filicis]GLZ81622.1 hypothetical protein Afil01_64290 [Actinorhabdospora filicis]
MPTTSPSPKGDADRRSLWERIDPSAPSPRPSLTAERIGRTAIAVADAEGLDAITMRRLATELGVAPMAAYRYVDGKDELLQLMGDLVHDEIELPEAGVPWRETFRTIALRTRELRLRHRWLAALPPEAAVIPSPHRMAITERLMASLDGLLPGPDERMATARSLHAYVGGAINYEASLVMLMENRGWASGHEVRTALAPEMTYLMESGRYPSIRAWALGAARKDDPSWEFTFGLDSLLDGIAARHGI